MGSILIKGASIVTMDDRLGDLSQGDLLVENGRIAAVAPEIDAADVELVDGRNRIVIPGFVNAHLHTWQTALRGVAADWTLPGYFRQMHAGLATRFRPEDIYIATLAGALNQIRCGTTTLVDWCHNNPTPAHTDAAVDALRESSIRAAFFHGSPKAEPRSGEPHYSELPHPRSEVERLLKGPFAAGNGRLELGLAILGPHYSTLEVARHDLRLARELGLVASMHQGGGPARTPGGWTRLMDEGLVGPGLNIVHGNDLGHEKLARFVDCGVSFTVTPENEMVQGHGFPITGRLRSLGTAPSLGVDLESVLSGDMFTVCRMALNLQRALDHAEHRRRVGEIAAMTSIGVREALRWATIEGARMLGLESRIGTLTPGKEADLVVLRADMGLWPVHDPVASVVMQGSVGDVEHVMIGGHFAKRDGRLLAGGLERVRDDLAESGRRILREHGLRAVT